MPITINHLTKVILVPVDFLTPVSGLLYELDVNDLRLALKDLEDDVSGMTLPDTHRHNTEVTLAGITFARTFEIINSYMVEFDDSVVSGYTVRCVGANHNLSDVKVLNSVSLIIGNSAGLIITDGSGTAPPTPAEIANAVWAHSTALDLTARIALAEAILRNKTITDPTTGVMTVYATDGVTPLLIGQLYEDTTGTQTYRGQGAERRERLQ